MSTFKKLRLSTLVVTLLLIPTSLSLNTVWAQDAATNYIPASAMMAVVARPADTLAHPAMELFPREIVSATAPKELGFDPTLITRFTLAVDTPVGMDRPPEFGAVLEFENPQKIGGNMLVGMEEYKIAGVTVHGNHSPFEPVIAQLDDRTIAFANERFLVKMLNAQDAKSELLTLIKNELGNKHAAAFMVMEPVRGLIKQNLPPANQVPPMFRDLLKIPDLTESVVLSGDFEDEKPFQLRINATSPAAATDMKRIMLEGMETGKQFAMMQIADGLEGADPDARAAAMAYSERVYQYIKKHVEPETSQDGQSLVFSSDAQASGQIATIGVLVGMLLPAVQQVREAARRVASKNTLRQFALASLNYEAAHMKFPAHAIYSDDGKPLLSWRVQILPYIEEEDLFDQFHMDEPWDSDHNIKLLDQMPEIFRSPNSVHTNKTVYQALVGPGTAMNGTKKGIRLGAIADGTSNSILFVETDDEFAQPWSKPADLEFDPDNPMNGLGNLRHGGFNAVFCDGSTHFIANTIQAQVFKHLALINDGQLTPRDF